LKVGDDGSLDGTGLLSSVGAEAADLDESIGTEPADRDEALFSSGITGSKVEAKALMSVPFDAQDVFEAKDHDLGTITAVSMFLS
jgi:hypothetical protein